MKNFKSGIIRATLAFALVFVTFCMLTSCSKKSSLVNGSHMSFAEPLAKDGYNKSYRGHGSSKDPCRYNKRQR